MKTRERARIVETAISQVYGTTLSKFPIKEVIEFRCTLTEETDRGCVLMAAANLDYELSELIKANLVQDKKTLIAFFESNGSASTFSAKIDLAYLLGLLSSDARHDLHLLRKIRNDFAHNPSKICFSDSPIYDRCFDLKLISIPDSRNARLRFTNSIMAVLAQIYIAKIEAVAKEPLENTDLIHFRKRTAEANSALGPILKELLHE